MNEQDYTALIDRCKVMIEQLRGHERNASLVAWDLADALAPIEIVNRGQNGKQNAEGVSLIQLADDLGVTKHWISQLRRAATRFPPNARIKDVGPAVHLAAQRGGRSPEQALQAMRGLGDKVRLRDFVPEIEDGATLRALRDRETAARIFASMTDADRKMWADVMKTPPQTVTRNGRGDTTLMTLRRCRSMLTTVSQVANGKMLEDEDFVQEIRACEEIVKALVDKVAAKA